MNFSDFRKYVESDCTHETIYRDSEGREILVISTLDAYTMAWHMAMKAVREERERCAQVCDARYMGDNNREDMEARRCAAAIREMK